MDNLGWGFGITLYGMGIVFTLLAVLWGLLALVMRMDNPPAPAAAQRAPDVEEPTADAAEADIEGARSDGGLDPALVAAIIVASLAHKARRRQEAAPVMRSYWPGSLLYASRWVASGRMRQNGTWQRGRG